MNSKIEDILNDNELLNSILDFILLLVKNKYNIYIKEHKD